MLFNALTSLIHGYMGRDRPSVAVLPITADTRKSSTCTAEQWKFVTCYCMILNLLQIEFKLCSVQQQLKDSSWIISSCGHHLSEGTASLMHIKHYQCENKSQSYILLYMSYNTRYTLYQCKAPFLKTLTIILNFNNILVIGRDNTIIIIIITDYYHHFYYY